MILEKENSSLDLLRRINFFYGLIGLVMMTQFGALHSWQSFLEGWLISVINFELLKHMGIVLFQKAGSHARLYILLTGKFIFWGLVIAFMIFAKNIQPIPFVIGILTILISAIGWSMREFFDART